MAISVKDIAWAAGFLEGEGYFSKRKGLQIAASQVQREPLERLIRIFGGTLYDDTEPRSPRHQKKTVWYAGSSLGAGIMLTIYCLMSPRRQEQIRQALARWTVKKVRPKFRTACPSGHPYTPENTYWYTKKSTEKTHYSEGTRQCKTCRSRRTTEYNARRAAVH